jgi:poly-gamma-glutamate capsule biosynthesis protein CapA/YwtB (metallophosphatase superfamily)
LIPHKKPTIDWSRGIIDWHQPESLENTTFLAVGDISLDASEVGIATDEVNVKGGDFLFSRMQQIFKSTDIIIGNLESPLSNRGTPIYKYGPNFRASPDWAKTLRRVGFTVLGVANNHARDYGNSSFMDTLRCLQKEGILPVGGGRNKSSALRPVIVRKRGMSIGILAFTYRQESVAGASRPGTADLDNSECYGSLKTLSEEVDLAIVYLHIDGEYSNYPAPYRIKAARRFIDLGAEMVIGHHAHVPQGIEIYKGRIIAYGLGNFVFGPEKERPLTSIGYVLKAKLTQTGTASVTIIPYRINYCCQCGRVCQPTPLSGAEHQETMAHLKHISTGLNDTNLIRLNWEEVASKDAIFLHKRILTSIIRREPYSLWSSQMAFLRQRYPELFKRLLTGKILRDLRSLLKYKLENQS